MLRCIRAILQNPFRQAREMDGVQKALAGLPGAVFYGAALLLITAAGALGYTAGSRAPGEGFCCHHPYLHAHKAGSHAASSMRCQHSNFPMVLGWRCCPCSSTQVPCA